MLAEQGIDVVCCSIAMYSDVREWNREHISNYREIYLKVRRETLLHRNQKGLYTSGKAVVGVSLPFDEPQSPDIVIQNDGFHIASISMLGGWRVGRSKWRGGGERHPGEQLPTASGHDGHK